MNSRTLRFIYNLIGLLLILAGVFIPPLTLIAWLRPLNTVSSLAIREQLLVGALLFKIGLFIIGLLIIVLNRFDIWDKEGQPAKTDRSGHKGSLAIMLALTGAALALRLFQLDAGLWHDEILTYIKFVRPMGLGEIVSTYISENQHFLYSLLARVSIVVFGEGAWTLRLPAVLFGLGSIWALYLFGREVGDEREAVLASALVTFSYHHIWFSQNARGYTGLLFWTLLSSWLLVRALNEERPQMWLYYAGAVALGVFTQLTMLFIVAGQFAAYLITIFMRRTEPWPVRWRGFFLGFCLAGLLTLQLHALALPQVFNNVVEESTIPAWKNPLWTLLEFIQGVNIGFASSIVAVGALVVFGAGVVSFARKNPIVLYLLFIPIILLTIVVVGVGHHLWPRFFFFAMGFGALIVVRGTLFFGQFMARLLNVSAPRQSWVGLALGLGLVLVSALSVPFVYGPKQDFQAALTFVEEHKAPGDAIVMVGLVKFTYINYYETNWTAVETLDALNTIRSGAKRTWLLYTFPPEAEAVYPEIMASVDHDFELVNKFPGTLRNGTIFVSRSDNGPIESFIEPSPQITEIR